ncbi:MAG TPA: cytochrome c-type biogenesis CcmF C-terminal domain-containing protein, partial [Vicinamibacterales bacterium]|nr:cytochrome c-type biogenesis CcmF C-terminal domain-containing protein [Vicinamibacterales bacterium]
FSAFFILFATMFPTLSEAVTGQRITVALPFFNKWMVPIGLILLLLTGVGPLLAWRKSTITNLRDSFMWPTIAAVITGAAVKAIGVALWSSGLCFALCAFVSGTIFQEFWRGARVRRQATGTDLFTAVIGLVGRNKRRYGGYIVHIGIVLVCLGFAGNGSKKDETVRLKPGAQATVGAFTVRNDRVTVTDDSQKQMVTAQIAVFRDGKQIDTMYPGRAVFRKHENEEARTDVAIRRSLAQDLYLVLPPDFDLATQSISLQIVVNPLVDWIWLGFGVLAFGTGIALLPERAYSFALAADPATAVATTAVLLIAMGLFGAVPLSAQMHVENATGSIAPVSSPLEQQLRQEIGCTCGGCAHEPLTKCTCSNAQRMRADLRAEIDKGGTHDQVVANLIHLYGSQEFLTAPVNSGFNRLAWLFPWAMGASGAVLVGIAAVKWSKRAPSDAEPASPNADPALEERLDDELRNLD